MEKKKISSEPALRKGARSYTCWTKSMHLVYVYRKYERDYEIEIQVLAYFGGQMVP